MALLAQLYDSGRAAERHMIGADATLRGHDRLPVDILVADLSTTGCLFACVEAFDLGREVTIGIAGIGRREARIVRALDQRYGCEFLAPLTDDDVSAASTMPADTIVRFPGWPLDAATGPDDAQPVGRLPGPVRLAVVIGATAAAWSAVIALLLLLR